MDLYHCSAICRYLPLRPHLIAELNTLRRIRELAHHYLVYVWIGILLIDLLSWTLDDNLRIPLNGLSAIGFTIVLVLGWRHGWNLCVTCAEKLPLDPQAAADEKINYLRNYHIVGMDFTWRKAWPWWLLFLVTFGLAVSSAWWFAYRQYRGLWAVPFDLVMVWFTRANDLHQRLQPWCKYCHDDEQDDDDEEIIDPVPSPGATV